MTLSKETIAVLESLAAMGNYVEVADKDGVYLYCSSNCIYDAVDSSELVGKHITDTLDLAEERSVLLETLSSGKAQRDTFLHHVSKTTGIEHYWIYNAFPVIVDGQVEGAIALYRTVSAIKSLMQSWDKRSLQTSTQATNGKTQNGARLYTFENIICGCEEMLNAIELAKRIAQRDTSVLLAGETGTGKELFAQSIHSCGPRKDKPFVAVNCGALPETLIESILFGTAKGAYTGAVDKRGLFEESSDGTIFLDELQSLSPEMQVKLLRVLETKRIRRVGGDREIPVNPKIISAINMNPLESVENGILKADLFYRIAVVTIEIPPLRCRQEDIPLLVNSFIADVNRRLGLHISACSRRVWEMFQAYPWPGNVRELRHVIEYAANIMDESETCIRLSHLPCHFQCKIDNYFQPAKGQSLQQSVAAVPGTSYPVGDYKATRQKAMEAFSDSFNRSFLTKALREYEGNISRTARAINISRQHLHELINKYQLFQEL